MRVMKGHTDGCANDRGQLAGEGLEVITRRECAHGELHMLGIALAIDRKASAVGTAIAHGPKHACHQCTELWLERRIFQKKSDYSAHVRPHTPVEIREA